jgi:hypothetical protein
MLRFITIKNNKIISDRFATSIVDGEVLDDGTYGEVGQVLINGAWVDDPVEVERQLKQQRILELKELITDKKLLDMDCTLEQLELKTLLGL